MTLMIAQEEEQGAFMGTGQNNLKQITDKNDKFFKSNYYFFSNI